VNYWTWVSSYGDYVAGTEDAVNDLTPAFVRVGGHSNDNNSPNPFDDAQLDAAVAYARAVGAQPIMQVPLLADVAGAVPTAATAAAMVTYANITKGYAVTYWSIGNEPDLYPDQQPTLAGYTPQDFCTSAQSFVAAMKAIDPTIKIVGPELSWKYQPGNDWLTPILNGCGALFDVVSIHRYPFAPTASTAAAAVGDAATFQGVIARVRGLMAAAGYGDRPLAITETNITYDGSPATSTLDGSPGTLAAGLWTADMAGTALSNGLWTMLYWSISEGLTLGLLEPPPAHAPRPAYWALRLYTQGFSPATLPVTGAPAGMHAYASRNRYGDGTDVIVVSWAATAETVTFAVTGAATPVQAPTLTIAPLSITEVNIRDQGTAPVVFTTYGQREFAAGNGPTTFVP
jgi:hypothetical protein